jgi:hypothetical protein
MKVAFHESTFKEKYSTSFLKVNNKIFYSGGMEAEMLRGQAFDHL